MEPMTSDLATKAEETESDRRRSTRTRVRSIEIRCEGDMHEVKDWSFGGCQFDGYPGKLRPGDMTSIELYLLGFSDCDCLPIIAEVIRFEADNNNTLALKFLELDAQTILNYCENVEKSLREKAPVSKG